MEKKMTRPAEKTKATGRPSVSGEFEVIDGGLFSVVHDLRSALEAFLDKTGRVMLVRVAEALESSPLDEKAQLPEQLVRLEGYISEIDRGIRGASYSEALDQLIHELQDTSSVAETALIRVPDNHAATAELKRTEHDVPLKSIVTNLVGMLFLVPVEDRLDEALAPPMGALTRVRGFIVACLDDSDRETDLESLRAQTAADIRKQLEILEQRLKVWVKGFQAELESHAILWTTKRRLPTKVRRRLISSARDRAQHRAEGYQRAFRGLLGALGADLELRRVEAQMMELVMAPVLNPAERIGSELANSMEVFHKNLKAAQDRLHRAAEKEDVAHVLESLSAQREQLRVRLREQVEPLLSALAEDSMGRGGAEALRHRLRDLALSLPERIYLLTPQALDELPGGDLPEFMPPVLVRAPARAILVSGVPWEVARARQKVVKLLSAARSRVEQVDRMIDFNLAPERLNVGDDQSPESIGLILEVSTGTLARASELVSDFPEELRAGANSISAEMLTSLGDAVADLRRNVLGTLEASGRRRTHYLGRFREGIKHVGLRFRASLARAADFLTRILGSPVRFLFRKREESGTDHLPSGVANPEQEGKAKEASLPHAYRMLFSSEPVPSPELLVGRGQSLARIAAALRRVSAGHPASVAVVGPPGSGRSSLVRVARDSVLSDIPSYVFPLEPGMDERSLARALGQRLGVRNPESLVQLESALSARTEPVAVIIDDVSALFCRAPSGMRTLVSLGRLITATSDKVLWIVTIVDPLWRYLMCIGRIPQSFNEIIHLKPLGPKEIEELIVARHDLSGYRLEYAPISFRARIGAFFQRPGRGRSYEHHLVFRRLAQVSGGIPELAILSWQRALEETGDGRLRVGEPWKPVVMPIVQEDLDALATLATILLQKVLHSVDHSRVFGWDLDKSERMLLILQQRGWIESVPISDPRIDHGYRVVPALRMLVYGALRDLGLLS